MANIGKGVSEVSNIVLRIVMAALVLGSILGATVFASITIVNVSELQTTFGAFVSAAIAFLVVGGTLLGILFILPYIRPLFKKGGLGMTA